MSRELRRRRWLARLETARRCERDLAAAELEGARAELDAAIQGIERMHAGARARVAEDRDRLDHARSVGDLEMVWEAHVAHESALVHAVADAHARARTRDELARALAGRSARLHAAERMHQRARADLQTRRDASERKMLDDLAPITLARRNDP